LKGKYIDATQDQQAIMDNIKTVEEDDLYVMRVKQFSTGKRDPYKDAPIG
jgi:hypothetical protein